VEGGHCACGKELTELVIACSSGDGVGFGLQCNVLVLVGKGYVGDRKVCLNGTQCS